MLYDSRKTNPIARSGAPRRCPATPGATRPGGRGARGKCAKRTQFPAGPGGTGANGCCTNKPNPCRHADPEIGVPGRANAQNEAKLRQAGISGDGTWGPCCAKHAKRTQFRPAKPVVQTNPIPRLGIADSQRPAACRQGLRGRLYKQTQLAGAKCAKQSQT